MDQKQISYKQFVECLARAYKKFLENDTPYTGSCYICLVLEAPDYDEEGVVYRYLMNELAHFGVYSIESLNHRERLIEHIKAIEKQNGKPFGVYLSEKYDGVAFSEPSRFASITWRYKWLCEHAESL